MPEASIVLFRRDLRVEDNPALSAAMANGGAVALYVLDHRADGRPLGGAARWWLHHALVRLHKKLTDLGVPLILRTGEQDLEVMDVVTKEQAGAVYWNRRYTPWGSEADTRLMAGLRSRGIAFVSFAGNYLRGPEEVRSRQGSWFKIFTPFYQASLAMEEPSAAMAAPRRQREQATVSRTERLCNLKLLPTAPDWADGLRNAWLGGFQAPGERLGEFMRLGIADYERNRNRPDLHGTSALSPYLAFGELSPRQVWHAARGAQESYPAGAEALLRQLVWREFCASLLHHFPDLAVRPFHSRFEHFPWTDDQALLNAWQQGRTGYPWIDAGMRQLRETGWMHNRVRMAVASFLTKHLLVRWQHGEAWFWDQLVDADPAQNITNWQWVAGCGPDAAPYFRIFNPISQGSKFDQTGGYLRRWQPAACDYNPGSAGIPPIVGHREGRERALQAFRSISRP